eukprot:5569177-Amphidinium_carterae.1
MCQRAKSLSIGIGFQSIQCDFMLSFFDIVQGHSHNADEVSMEDTCGGTRLAVARCPPWAQWFSERACRSKRLAPLADRARSLHPEPLQQGLHPA